MTFTQKECFDGLAETRASVDGDGQLEGRNSQRLRDAALTRARD